MAMDATSGSPGVERNSAFGVEPIIVRNGRGDGSKTKGVSIEDATLAPVTYVPSGDANPVRGSTRSWGSIVSGFFNAWKVPVYACLIAGALSLAGCATSRQGGIHIGAPMSPNGGVTIGADAGHVQDPALKKLLAAIPADSSSKVQTITKSLTSSILGSSTPYVRMAMGNGSSDEVVPPSYRPVDKSSEIDVTDLGPSGKLAVRVLAPQSGHVSDGQNSGDRMAEHYADIGTAEISFRGPDGKNLRLWSEDGTEFKDGVARVPFAGKLVASAGFVVELKPGANSLRFSPFPEARPDLDCNTKTTNTSKGNPVAPHSAHSFRVGPDDYLGGRIIKLAWDGK